MGGMLPASCEAALRLPPRVALEWTPMAALFMLDVRHLAFEGHAGVRYRWYTAVTAVARYQTAARGAVMMLLVRLVTVNLGAEVSSMRVAGHAKEESAAARRMPVSLFCWYGLAVTTRCKALRLGACPINVVLLARVAGTTRCKALWLGARHVDMADRPQKLLLYIAECWNCGPCRVGQVPALGLGRMR